MRQSSSVTIESVAQQTANPDGVVNADLRYADLLQARRGSG